MPVRETQGGYGVRVQDQRVETGSRCRKWDWGLGFQGLVFSFWGLRLRV